MEGNYMSSKVSRCSEILNFNPRLNAAEDFMHRTMDVLHGVWSKLNYIRELRKGDGGYEHWGLTRVHGQNAAERAIASVHSDLYLQLLRTPIPELINQLQLSADDVDCTAAELAKHLQQKQPDIIPQELRGATPEHLRFVLLVTNLLEKQSVARPQVENAE
jgi:hypothetical protein